MSREVVWPDAMPDVRLPKGDEKEAVLLQPWRVDVRGHLIRIPTDTTTDGASIPRFLWRVCGTPFDNPRVYAALVHDCLYRGIVCWGVTREEADEVYYAMLVALGIPKWKAGIEFYALRAFGSANWKGAVYR